jgi:hypothetical protein
MTAITEGVLRTALITFNTNDEDKDHDTRVTVTVRDTTGVVAARVSDEFGQFDDSSNNGPYALLIGNASPKSSLEGGSARIHIAPIHGLGNDKWRFGFMLNLIFSDGSHQNAQADQLWLDQEQKSLDVGIA